MIKHRLTLPILYLSIILVSQIILAQNSISSLSKYASNIAIKNGEKDYYPIAKKQWSDKKIIDKEGNIMKFEYKIFGEKPTDGRNLFISLHGGGGTTKEVNDQQWENQINLYQPKEGVYIAPRAPTNNWNLWHEAHIDFLIEELIKTAVLMEEVNFDKVYLIGYSAGGDGVYQLAPRMADLFAAASTMAGHPNDANPLSLRNLPFAIFMGGLDSAYDRNKVAKEWGKKLDLLKKDDKNGYIHNLTIYPEYGHWLNREDTVALDWMTQFKRNANPSKLVWVQDDVPHKKFYWLEIPDKENAEGKKLEVEIIGQSIYVIENEYRSFKINLNDRLLNLDLPIDLYYEGALIYSGNAQRTDENILKSSKNLDPSRIYPAYISVSF